MSEAELRGVILLALDGDSGEFFELFGSVVDIIKELPADYLREKLLKSDHSLWGWSDYIELYKNGHRYGED